MKAAVLFTALAFSLFQVQPYAVLLPKTAKETPTGFEVEYELGHSDVYVVHFWGPKPTNVEAVYDGKKGKNGGESIHVDGTRIYVHNLYNAKASLRIICEEDIGDIPDFASLRMKAIPETMNQGKAGQLFFAEVGAYVQQQNGVCGIQYLDNGGWQITFQQGAYRNKDGSITEQGMAIQRGIQTIGARLNIFAIRFTEQMDEEQQ